MLGGTLRVMDKFSFARRSPARVVHTTASALACVLVFLVICLSFFPPFYFTYFVARGHLELPPSRETHSRLPSRAHHLRARVLFANVQRYLDEEPAVKPLALLIKYYLKQFGMNEPYTGGLGSYALIIMIISYLQVPSTPGARRLMSC